MKVYVVIGQNNILGKTGPLGVARTTEGRDAILRRAGHYSDAMKTFELEIEEDKAPKAAAVA